MDRFASARRFLQLTALERRLFLEAALLLVLMRAVLSLFRFRTLWTWLERKGVLQPNRPPYFQAIQQNQIARALARASRRVPGTTCLTQALAGALMLSRQGHPASLCIGVAKEGNEFGAHAWVECEGRQVVGSKAHFHTLLVLSAATP